MTYEGFERDQAELEESRRYWLAAKKKAEQLLALLNDHKDEGDGR